MNPSLNLPAFKAFYTSKLTRKLRANVLACEITAVSTRKRVDALLAPEFEKFEFWTAEVTRRGEVRKPERITHEDRLYRCKDEAKVEAWYARRAEVLKAAGFELVQDDHCPALIAEHELIKAENALIEHARGALGLPEIWNMEHRKQLLTILTGRL